jgi:hypothetical protein
MSLETLDNLTFLLERYLRFSETEVQKLPFHVALKRQSQIGKELERLQKAAEAAKDSNIAFSW